MSAERARGAAAAVDAAPLVAVRHVSVVSGQRRVLDGITFTLAEGRFLGIIGPNGAGKTTLLKVLLGLVTPTRGDVEVFGERPSRLGRRRHRIGYVPQRPEFDHRFPVAVRDVVMMGRYCCLGVLRFPRRRDWQKVEETIEQVGLAGSESRLIGELSGGELQRALLARALCAETRLLLLDEPTSGLDLPAQEEFYRLLLCLRSDLGLTTIVVSHDLLALGAYADELICISGTMHIHGNPQTVLQSDQLREAYRCEFDFLSAEGRGPVARVRR
jgi:ABC-type Mn2+/Zn2+ transport system ATPase subunit